MNRPEYQNKDWLLKKYAETGSIHRMASEAGCSSTTIYNWMVKCKIPMHSMRGIKKSEESVRRSAEARKGKPGPMRGKRHTAETRAKMSASRKKSQNPNWKGGKTEKIRKFRRSKEYIQWTAAVAERAGGICEICSSSQDLQAHHIVSLHEDFSKALDITNGQLLCKSCHKRIHGGKIHE